MDKDIKKHLRFNLLAISLFAVLIINLYQTSILYNFTALDDRQFVVTNPYIALSWDNFINYFTNLHFAMYIPFTLLSYSFDHSIWNFSSFGYHLQNLFWFFLTVTFMYKIMIRLQINQLIAFLLCIFYIVNPQRVESVVWIAERKDVLCSAFYFMSLLSYINNWRYGKCISLILFILSLLSKPMSITLPFILLAYEFYRTKYVSIKYYIFRLWPFFIISFVMLPVTYIGQADLKGVDKYTSFFVKTYSFTYNLLWYFKQIFYPSEICPLYAKISLSMTYMYVVISYIIIAAFLLFLFLYKRKLVIYSILPLVLAYVITLLPVGGIVRLGSIDHADRYSLIASFYVLIGVGALLNYFKDNIGNNIIFFKTFLVKGKFLYLISIIIIILSSVVFFLLNSIYQKIWEHEALLYKYSSEFMPANQYALEKLAVYEYVVGDYQKVYSLTSKMYECASLDNQSKVYTEGLRVYATYCRFRVLYAIKNYKQALSLYDYLNPLVLHVFKDNAVYLNFEITAAFCFFHNNMKSEAIKILEFVANLPEATKDDKEVFKKIKEVFLAGNYKAVNALEDNLNLVGFFKTND